MTREPRLRWLCRWFSGSEGLSLDVHLSSPVLPLEQRVKPESGWGQHRDRSRKTWSEVREENTSDPRGQSLHRWVEEGSVFVCHLWIWGLTTSDGRREWTSRVSSRCDSLSSSELTSRRSKARIQRVRSVGQSKSGVYFASDRKTFSDEDRVVRKKTFCELSGNALAFGDLRGNRGIDSPSCTWIKWSVAIIAFTVGGHDLAFGKLRGSLRIGSAFCWCGSTEWRPLDVREESDLRIKKRRHIIADGLIAEGYIVSVPKKALTVISSLIVRLFSPEVHWGWSPPMMAFDVTQQLTEWCESDRYPIEWWRRSNSFQVSGHAVGVGNFGGAVVLDPRSVGHWQEAESIRRLSRSLPKGRAWPLTGNELLRHHRSMRYRLGLTSLRQLLSDIESHHWWRPSPVNLGWEQADYESRWQLMLSSAKRPYSP